MQTIKQSEATAARRIFPVAFVSDTDGKTPVTGITVSAGDVKVSKGGSGAEANHAGTLTELAGGDYYYTPTTGEIDTLGVLKVRFVKSGSLTFRAAVQIVAFDPYAAQTFTNRDLGIIETGTCNANCTSTLVTLKSGTAGANIGDLIDFSNTLNGVCHVVTAYSTGVATVSPSLPAGLVGTAPTYYLRVGVRAPTGANATPVNLDALATKAVWDYLIAGSSGVAGSTAASLASTADPWGIAIPGAYASGTAGYKVGNSNTNAGVILASTEPVIVADALLNRNIRGGSTSGRRVYEALAFLRNKWVVNPSSVPPTITVFDQDDTTPLFTGTLGTSAAFDSVITLDPTGP